MYIPLSDMEPLPFNACDYRCERCLATERCAVFRGLPDRDAHDPTLGSDPEGGDAALRDASGIFDETNGMLAEDTEEDAGEPGIDPDGSYVAGLRDRHEEAKNDPLYLLAFACMMETRDFLKTADPAVLPAGRDALEDIRWHHTIVPVKVFRAIRSDADPEMRFDAVNSAAVAVNSLTICIMAFDVLASAYPVIAQACKRLSLKASELKQYISSRFHSDK